jgi:hypothetical protein
MTHSRAGCATPTRAMYPQPSMQASRFPARVASLATFALSLFVAANASAFCRSTTCQGDCPLDENGCPSTGIPLIWNRPCVGFSLQQSGTQMLDISDVRVTVATSFGAWAGLDCSGMPASITFSELADVSCDKAEYNQGGKNVNVIIFRDDSWTYQGIDGTLAKTSVTFDVNTGEIFDADIEVNSAYNDLTVGDSGVQYDLQSILTHEVGHFIGIAHTLDPNATMFASYTPGTFSIRTLSPDDTMAACTVYPPTRQAGTCDTTPIGGFGETCNDPTSSGCTIAQGHDDDASHASSNASLVFCALSACAITWSRRKRKFAKVRI